MMSVLDSRYRVEEEIGSGGMGKVYRAFDIRLNIPVAIKFTSPGNPDEAAIFYREAELLSNLHHPALPRVIDFNRADEMQYIVMEYIEGDDLKTQLENRKTPFGQTEVLNWAKQLLNVLSYLHGQGIQHRDIKPANIKVRNNQIFLLDFGIAYGQVGEMLTIGTYDFHGWRAATKDYASLEQLNGKKTTPASDIYSLAATLYVLLSGTLPENAGDRIQQIALQQTDSLKPIGLLVPLLNQNAANAIISALELDAHRRPQSAEQMYMLMFPAETAYKPKKSVFRKIAVASGVLSLMLLGVFLGANISKVLPDTSPAVKVAAEEHRVTPREEAARLTEESLTLLQSAKYGEAIKKCEAALAKDATYTYAHFVCGDAIWDTKYDDSKSFAQMTLVQEHADKILSLVSSPQTAEDFASRAWANLAKEKYDIAIADSSKALEINPNLVAALMIRASAKSFIPDENNKQILSAFDDYNKAVQLMPNYVQARANLASSYYQLRKYEWAISEYTEAIRILPAARYYQGRADCYYAQEKYQEARKEYQEALKLNPKYLSAQIGIANTFLMEEDWDNAVRTYSKSISIDPTFIAHHNRGRAQIQLEKFEKAIKDFNAALEFDDTDYSTYFYRGFAFAKKTNFKQALSDFSKAIERVPENDREALAELYKYRAAVYFELGKESEAKTDEKRAETLSK